MACGIRFQPSLRDSRPFGVEPSVETLGYSRLSLRDSKAAPAVFPCRQDGPGVQQYDLWIMTSPLGERVPEGRARGIRCGSRSRCAICKFHRRVSTTATLCVSGARPSGRFSVTSSKSGGTCSDSPALLVVKRRKRRAPCERFTKCRCSVRSLFTAPAASRSKSPNPASQEISVMSTLVHGSLGEEFFLP